MATKLSEVNVVAAALALLQVMASVVVVVIDAATVNMCKLARSVALVQAEQRISCAQTQHSKREAYCSTTKLKVYCAAHAHVQPLCCAW